jgi:amino acid transporter
MGIAVGVLTLIIVLHTFSRRGGLMVNNAFAVAKVCLLLVIFFLGVAKASGRLGGSGNVVRNNFSRDVFVTNRTDISSWSNSLLLCTCKQTTALPLLVNG